MTVICKEIVPQFCCCQFPPWCEECGNTALCETNRQRCILWLGMGAIDFNAIQCNLAYWIMYFEERLILNANNSVQIPHLPSLLYHLFGPFFMDSWKVRFSKIFLKQTPSFWCIFRIVENSSILGLNSSNILYTCDKVGHLHTEYCSVSTSVSYL